MIKETIFNKPDLKTFTACKEFTYLTYLDNIWDLGFDDTFNLIDDGICQWLEENWMLSKGIAYNLVDGAAYAKCRELIGDKIFYQTWDEEFESVDDWKIDPYILEGLND